MLPVAHRFPTHGQPLVIEVEIDYKGKAPLNIRAFDLAKRNTVYLNTNADPKNWKSNNGLKKFVFPFPLTPDWLAFEFRGNYPAKLAPKIISAKARRLNLPAPTQNSETMEFIRHATNFALQAGYCPASPSGVGYDYHGKYPIVYKDRIRDLDATKRNMVVYTTPARIKVLPQGPNQPKKYLVIECASEPFRSFTVPMRVMILMHEWMHYHLQTRSEKVADEYAFDLCKKMGYPTIELVAAITQTMAGIDYSGLPPAAREKVSKESFERMSQALKKHKQARRAA